MFKAKTEGDSLYIDLAPNKSSSINENLVFFGFLSLICLTFGIGFFFIGATMILPFAGLEVLALILILRVNRKWLNQKQALYLDKLYVELEEDNKKITFDRFLSKFLIEENNSKKELFIKSNNQKIEIASFLNQEEKEVIMAQLMAQVKQIITYFYRKTKGQDSVKSDRSLSYAGDFLNLMFNRNGYEIDEKVAEALDTLLILHADHEQNCSTSTVRVVGSSKVNLFASVSSGIDALWGQLHGGANQAVLEMLEKIQDEGGGYKKAIERAKDKSDPFRLMGFGHRVYKSFDPRAKIIKKACDTILEQLGINDPLLDIAKGLEEQALNDDYFKERNLYPNVDFYSGIIYRALGIPTNMFTAMFVLGRLPGWMAQWKEMLEDSSFRIARPRQIYTGQGKREFVPIDLRE